MRYAMILLTVLAAGCATRTYTPPTQYLLDPQFDVQQVKSTDKTLAIRILEPARPYRQQIIYRDGLELGQFANAEWAELPADVVTHTLADAIRATKRFTDVGIVPNVGQPDYSLTGAVREFDVRKDVEPWTAECEVRIEVRAALGSQVLYADTLRATVPLESNDLSGLPPAMSQAISDIVSRAANGIAGS